MFDGGVYVEAIVSRIPLLPLDSVAEFMETFK